MTGLRYNILPGHEEVCVEKKTHVLLNHGGDPVMIGPCDGSCVPCEIELSPECAEVVYNFLANPEGGWNYEEHYYEEDNYEVDGYSGDDW